MLLQWELELAVPIEWMPSNLSAFQWQLDKGQRLNPSLEVHLVDELLGVPLQYCQERSWTGDLLGSVVPLNLVIVKYHL
jgi:hypothetical protein